MAVWKAWDVVRLWQVVPEHLYPVRRIQGLWWLENSEGKRHFCNIDIDGDLLSFKAIDANQVVFDELVLDKKTMGTNDFSPTGSLVYPNPSNGEFYIEVPPGERFSYRIFNSVGQLISELRNGNASVTPVQN